MTRATPYRTGVARLVAWAAASEACYVGVWACGLSLHEAATGDHRLLLLLSLFAAAFVCHLGALRCALSMPGDRVPTKLIFGAAVLFRITALFSDPIEEIDLYRYLWDGQAVISRVSPYRYSPEQVLSVASGDDIPEDLRRLVQSREREPANALVLSRIHFPQLPTIYPPVSQAVFALAMLTTPKSASVYWRMVGMKGWFVVFEVATIGLLVHLLRRTRGHPGWTIAYAWCPLVVKEIANSGHLDALATFFAVASVVAAIHAADASGNRHRAAAYAALSVALLALGVGAKLYPVVLAPVVLLFLWKRLGAGATLSLAVLFAALCVMLLWPMVPRERLDPIPQSPRPFPETRVSEEPDLPPAPLLEAAIAPRDPSQSLRAFLSQWEMNDFLFMIVIENLRPAAGLPNEKVAWFAVVPETWRAALVQHGQVFSGQPPERIPFLATRSLLSVAFLGFALLLAWKGAKSEDANAILRGAFLTLAWFWLLLPTANPWYLTWALPFLPFARGRAWLALSGLAFLYYVRFWLSAQFPATPLLGTPYSGAMFFDYIVTWLEFGPWLVWLAWEYWRCGGTR